jgi:hypothetical protein
MLLPVWGYVQIDADEGLGRHRGLAEVAAMSMLNNNIYKCRVGDNGYSAGRYPVERGSRV